jgi:hypothetical protein
MSDTDPDANGETMRIVGWEFALGEGRGQREDERRQRGQPFHGLRR